MSSILVHCSTTQVFELLKVRLLKKALCGIYINPRHICMNNQAACSPPPQHENNHFKFSFFGEIYVILRLSVWFLSWFDRKAGNLLCLTPTFIEDETSWTTGKLVIKDSPHFPSVKDIHSVRFLSPPPCETGFPANYAMSSHCCY